MQNSKRPLKILIWLSMISKQMKTKTLETDLKMNGPIMPHQCRFWLSVTTNLTHLTAETVVTIRFVCLYSQEGCQRAKKCKFSHAPNNASIQDEMYVFRVPSLTPFHSHYHVLFSGRKFCLAHILGLCYHVKTVTGSKCPILTTFNSCWKVPFGGMMHRLEQIPDS